MQLRVDPKGEVVTLYSETIDLAMLAELSISRASSVELQLSADSPAIQPRYC
jgi:hypothetical protein